MSWVLWILFAYNTINLIGAVITKGDWMFMAIANILLIAFNWVVEHTYILEEKECEG